MGKKVHNKKEVARIENWFVFNSQYSLTAKEQKVVLFLISQISPQQKAFEEQSIRVTELKKLLETGVKAGSFYSEMDRITKSLIARNIEFPTGIKYDGKALPGRINWFQSIVPMKKDEGDVVLEFIFSNRLKPFLLELQEYAQIDYKEAFALGSGFSIRMFQIFRAHRDKFAKYQRTSELKYGLDDLKQLLGIPGKYDDFRNFRKRVLEVLVSEIKKETSINVSYETIKEGRRVAKIKFIFSDKKRNKTTDEKSEIVYTNQNLTFAQVKAVQMLVDLEVYEGIVFKQILPCLINPEWEGFEDIAIEKMISIFKSKARVKNGGTFVNWFLERKVFEQGDNFAKIMEQVQKYKKDLQHNHPDRWDNRLLARKMTATEFKKKIKA